VNISTFFLHIWSHEFTVSMEDQYCRRQGRTLKRGKGTSEEGFKLGLFGELEKMATFYYNKKE
jgi:hypothetical protein